MEHVPTPTTLITRPASLPPRQNKKVLGIVCGIVGLGAVLFIIWKMGGQRLVIDRGQLRDRPVAEHTILTPPRQPREDLRMSTSYQGQALPTQVPTTPGPALLPQESSATPAVLQDAPPPSGRPPLTMPRRPDPPPQLPSPPPAPPLQSAPAVRAALPPPKPEEPPKRWFTTVSATTGIGAPFPETEADQAKRQESKLFSKAVWERPKDPTKVLYVDQIIHGQILQDMNSDIPGSVRVKVIQDVPDRWGHGQVLVPRDTTFLVVQQGTAVYGQSRFAVTVPMAILPDGTAIKWNEGQAGDARGAPGIPAKVDNKIPQLLLMTGLSAVLSIGARAPFGSTQNFNPSLPQEFAEDISRDINRSGQSILERQLNLKPTLTQKAGYPVTIMFKENISFMTQPSIVSK